MSQLCYCFHGLRLTISATERILAALRARLGEFQPANGGASNSIDFDFVSLTAASAQLVSQPSGSGQRFLELEIGTALYFEQTQQLYLEVPGCARAVADLKTHRVCVAHGTLDTRRLWLLSHFFFTIPLAELLKRQGLFMVHAAGLALDGRGLLLAGQSGSGKTTLALALLRAGFQFLGDDTVFVDRHARVFAFPDEIDLTPQTAAFFPELHGLVLPSEPGERPKRPFNERQVYGVVPCWDCTPAVVLFPRPSQLQESVLRPLRKDQALLRLVCNVVRTGLASCQAHLDALGALVARCRCYGLETGLDFDQLPALLRSTLGKGTP